MICTFQHLIYPRQTPVPENSFMVAVYRSESKLKGLDGKTLSRITVVGHSLPTAKGIKFNLQGKWEKNDRGTQFQLHSYKEVVEPTKSAIIAYLSSGLIKGIGAGLAQKIYDRFGMNTMKVLSESPDQLLQISGISEGKLNAIKDSIALSHGVQELMHAMKPYLTAKTAVQILGQYKSEAVRLAAENPYLFFIDGFLSFPDADKIAHTNGIASVTKERLEAGIVYCLRLQERSGHLCMPKGQLIRACMGLLKLQAHCRSRLCEAANAMYKEQKIQVYKDHVFLHAAERAELDVASKVKSMSAFGYTNYSMNVDAQMFRLQEKLGLKLSKQQEKAVTTSLYSSISVITGGPGTGKTQVLQFILEIYKSEFPDFEVICCAPTGRAARRMEEATGLPASTIHSALSITTLDSGELSEACKLNAGLIVIDEVSMLDMYLAQRLFEAIPYDCKVILVGDADQLPSVGPGAVLSELIASGKVPVTKLEKVFRQKSGSRIAMNAALIRRDNVGLEYGSDFVLRESADISNSASLLLDTYMEEVSKHGLDHVTVLSPFRTKLETGVEPLNQKIREYINPLEPGKGEITVRNRVFRAGDKVMQTKNTGEINNGDIGYIWEILTEGKSKKALIEFDGARLKSYSPEDLVFVELGYATTIHKAQGSEYHTVILSLQEAHGIMLKRPLVYTAVTRARERLIIIGERSALVKAIHTMETEKRLTMLAEKICIGEEGFCESQ